VAIFVPIANDWRGEQQLLRLHRGTARWLTVCKKIISEKTTNAYVMDGRQGGS
jgi:hypothetical protein